MSDFDKWWKEQHIGNPDPLLMGVCRAAFYGGKMAERKACAQVCEGLAEKLYAHARAPYLDAAEAIRARHD